MGLWANSARKSALDAEAKEKAQRLLAEKNARIAESRRLAVLSDSVRPERLDVAMLLALEALVEDTSESRGSLQRCLDDRPEVTRFLHVPEGPVSSVAFDPQGRIAAGYYHGGGVGGGVVVFDARGERLRPTPLEVKEGSVRSVAFDPQGRIAAGHHVVRGGVDVVVFDGDPASWRQKVERVANRNFTWQEWTQYFPESPYHRTIRSRSWPADLSQAERARAEAAEQVPMKGKDAS